MKTLLCSFFLALIITSCQNTYHETANGSRYDTLLGRQVIFPAALSVLDGAKFTEGNSLRHETVGKMKFVSILDGGCSSCIIDQLNVLDSLARDAFSTSRLAVVFVLNVPESDSAYFMLNLQPLIKAKGSILLDRDYDFETSNALFSSDIHLRTFLLDDRDKIVLCGNPLFDTKVLSEYVQIINQKR